MDLQQVDALIRVAFEEDFPWGDITTENLIDPRHQTAFSMIIKEEGIIAGLGVANRVFHLLDETIAFQALVADGDLCSPGQSIARIQGSSQKILIGERIALNFIQRLSGIATLTHRYVGKAREKSASVRVTDTRKTTPGLRYLEKYAVQTGGGANHRYCLSDAVMLKDNHIAMLKEQGISVQAAVERLRAKIPHTTKIEIEVDTVAQIEEMLAAGADIILLDNMTCDELRQAVHLIGGRAVTEASGGVSLDTIADIAETGVDAISVGALTHSAPSLDIGLDFL